ncbi:uncharacterized protein LOC122249425 [Penaeus japonicus]|uniref:uncharacterized protein LOC122249425 n=1 Tax=Penaeus japonicus TaxID=27405 RepID=UPI001C710B53|nr:uncharacterized protein LOC122249425 [Penaeus japonicus]
MIRPLVVLIACVAIVYIVPGMAEPEPEPDSNVKVKIDPGNSKSNSKVEIGKTEDELFVNVKSEFTGEKDPEELCCEVEETKYEDGEMWTYSNGTECECDEGVARCTHDTLE